MVTPEDRSVTTPTPAQIAERYGRWLDNIGFHGSDTSAPVVMLKSYLALCERVRALEEGLGEFCLAAECAAGCDEGVTEDDATSEIMSAMGSPMTVAYTRARASLIDSQTETTHD